MRAHGWPGCRGRSLRCSASDLWKELEIVGSKIYGTVASGSEFGAAVRRMGSVSSELAALQTHHFGLDQIMEAFRIADDKSSRSVKVTIG